MYPDWILIIHFGGYNWHCPGRKRRGAAGASWTGGIRGL